METRAHHTLIGAFVLSFIAIGVGFSLWLGKYQFDRQYAYYDIVFTESVSGLSVGSDVRYQGILIGDIARIRVDPSETDKIRVTVRIEQRDDIEIRSTTTASQAIQGLTGGTFIEIANPSENGNQLPQDHELKGIHPLIQYQRSSLQSIFADDFPTLLRNGDKFLLTADAFLKDLNDLINEENRQVIGQTLKNVETLTRAVADQDDNIQRIIANSADITDDAGALVKRSIGFLDNLDTLIVDADGLVKGEARVALIEFSRAANDLSRVIRENEDDFGTFASQGLAQLALFVSDARRLAVRLERFTKRLESNPSGFLFGGTTPQQTPRKD
ncbi:MAG: MlaD family protein [Alphaproteobacteria bacterium]